MKNNQRKVIGVEFLRNMTDFRRGLLYFIVIFSLAFLSLLSVETIKGSIYDYNGLGSIEIDVIFYSFYNNVVFYACILFAAIGAFLISTDYEGGVIGVNNSMGIPTLKIIWGKALFLYVLILINLFIDFSIAFAFFHNNSTVTLSYINLHSFMIFILWISLIEMLFVLIGILIGTVFAKRINSIIAALAGGFLIETLGSGYGTKLISLRNFRQVCIFHGSTTSYLQTAVNPISLKSFLAVFLNFYSNEYINPNCAGSSNTISYSTSILYMPSDYFLYVIQAVIYLSVVISIIFIGVTIRRRYY